MIQHSLSKKIKSTALVLCHTVGMAGVREQQRVKITAAILDEGRRQLAEVGASGLSLRAIARELDMVSSAVYRYVASRDELLTRLIVGAFDSLGVAIEDAIAAQIENGPAERWVAAAHGIRDWATAHPNEYFLVFGSPVPGYAAPDDTVGPGTRVPRALVAIVADAAKAQQLRRPHRSSGHVPDAVVSDFDRLRAAAPVPALSGVSDAVIAAVLTAWMQIFGLISFELSNQTRGVVEHHREFFEMAARESAALIGLHAAP
jgi:AcrR family transcriptional regulator